MTPAAVGFRLPAPPSNALINSSTCHRDFLTHFFGFWCAILLPQYPYRDTDPLPNRVCVPIGWNLIQVLRSGNCDMMRFANGTEGLSHKFKRLLNAQWRFDPRSTGSCSDIDAPPTMIWAYQSWNSALMVFIKSTPNTGMSRGMQYIYQSDHIY